MNQQELIRYVPQLEPIIANANHVDIKTVEGDISMRQFIAGMFSYYPDWLKTLYGIRWGFVRLLGMKQEGLPQAVQMWAEDVPMRAGENATFFKVELAEENRFWVAGASESHLTAHLGVVVEPLAQGNRFYVLTIVHYHRWTGPVYFKVIRPFHHLVVRKMAQAGLSYRPEAPVMA